MVDARPSSTVPAIAQARGARRGHVTAGARTGNSGSLICHDGAVSRVRGAWPIALVIVGLAATMVVDLGRPFGNGDEVLYAQGIREMQGGAGYAVLHWGGHEVLERPVAPFVVAAVGAALVEGEVGLRLTSLLCALATLALVYAIARRVAGRTDVALVAVVLCGLAPSFHLFSRALLSDPPFMVAVLAALGATVRAMDDPRGLVPAGLALGAATALKSLAAGPALIVLVPWLVVAARRHRAGRALAGAGLGFVLLAAPFFVFALATRGEQFLDEHLGRALVARAAGDLHHLGMAGGAAAYLRYLVAIDGPLVTAWLALGTLGGLGLALHRRDRGLAVVASFGLVFTLALSLIGTRLPHYLLPLYPAAAIGVAGVLARGLEAIERRRPGPLPRIVALAGAIAVGASGLARRDVEAHFMPDSAAVALGRAARAAVPAGQPIHALEWYAPALAYYADRPLRIVTASPRLFDVVDAVDYFHATGVPRRAPLEGESGPLWVAGPRRAIDAAARWLAVDAELAASDDHVLIRAHLLAAPAPADRE
jgi:4-amino-4-deoxy-L-arabinose transferase-like glycosyltransferase